MKRGRPAAAVALTGAILLLGGFWAAFPAGAAPDGGAQQTTIPPVPAQVAYESTADHSLFPNLQEDFQTGPEVTAACLYCHGNAAAQVMKTSHWKWICPRAKAMLEEKEHVAIGKAEHIINNFCIALPSNEPRCTSCHSGYGWKDKTFDFGDETLVDCLICHDQTGTYKKFPTGAGHPVYAKDFPEGRPFMGKTWPPVDLGEVARHVGKPTRQNCGTCHFFGGGGEGVKHGDMDVTLATPDRELDVHMGVDGPNYRCQACHTTRNHQIAGRCFLTPAYRERAYALRGQEENLLACESCHSARPHREAKDKLNDHSDKVSCEACHVPSIAPRKATKMWWDWSKAGEKTADGKPLVRMDPDLGESVYDGKKGEFIWARDAVPEYIWFDGRIKHSFMGDAVDDETPYSAMHQQYIGRHDNLDPAKPVVRINWVETHYDAPGARIYPAKIMRGVQPYDPVNKTLVVPKLFPGEPNGSEAYWKSYDWDRSITAGMAYAGLPYSGEYGWIQTEMIWPLKHMVVPRERALDCRECHTRSSDGRLAQLTDFYLPGRDYNAALDWVGIILVAGAVLASLVHGLARAASRGKEAGR